MIPGLERSSGEGNGNPLQNSCLESPRTEEPGRLQSMGCKGSDKTEPLTDTHTLVYFYVTIYQAVGFFFLCVCSTEHSSK